MSPVELNPTANPAAANSPAPETEHASATKEMTLAQIAAECHDTQPLSVQSVYAGMQREQARLCKDAAQRKAKDMQEIQEKQAMDDVTVYKMDKDQWEYNLKSLTTYQEQVGSMTQSIMVSLQDFLGQFNSFMQGANAAITEAIRLQSKIIPANNSHL